MECKNCQGLCIKKGCQNRKQRYRCKNCGLYQLRTYRNKFCTPEDEKLMVKLNNEGVSISGISRITGMSKANVTRKIKLIASKIKKRKPEEAYQEYEVDELQTFIKNKNERCYIIYAINKKTKNIIDYSVGPRTKENIGKVISVLNSLNPKRIYTDKLNIYPGLINQEIHVASSYKINHIERFNLTLRTHLKRLSRKTICFSKSKEMLVNCLRIYLFRKNNVKLR